MARKKKHEEHVNHERWLVSYADFITLLFAFFVVMYSISSVNEGKYRVLSDSISAAFDPSQAGLPIKLSSPLRPPIVDREFLTRTEDTVNIQNQYPNQSTGPKASEKDKINLRKISQQVSKSLAPLVEKDLIKLTNNDLWIEIEIKSSILFASGSARLAPQARPILRKIGEILGKFDNQVQVEGFTDNVPIDTEEFPSNWELSSARAASVVHLLAGAKVDPRRLSAVGYGEFKPIASNDTPAGRRKNRRISIVVLSDAIARTTDRVEQLEKALADERQARRKTAPAPHAPALGAPVQLLPPVRQEQ